MNISLDLRKVGSFCIDVEWETKHTQHLYYTEWAYYYM